MTHQEKPRPTAAEYAKRQEILNELGEESDAYLEFLNAYNWSTQMFKDDELYGLKDAKGDVILEAGYEGFRLFSSDELQKEDRVVAKLNGHWGVLVIKNSGSWLIEPEYDDIGYPDVLTHVRKDNQWGVLNIEKKDFVLPLGGGHMQAESGFMFVNGIGVYENKGKFGVILENGSYTKAHFDKVDDEPFGLVKVRQNKVWGYIDTNGDFTLKKNEADPIYSYKG